MFVAKFMLFSFKSIFVIALLDEIEFSSDFKMRDFFKVVILTDSFEWFPLIVITT